jgi:hypothetical protein
MLRPFHISKNLHQKPRDTKKIIFVSFHLFYYIIDTSQIHTHILMPSCFAKRLIFHVLPKLKKYQTKIVRYQTVGVALNWLKFGKLRACLYPRAAGPEWRALLKLNGDARARVGRRVGGCALRQTDANGGGRRESEARRRGAEAEGGAQQLDVFGYTD